MTKPSMLLLSLYFLNVILLQVLLATNSVLSKRCHDDESLALLQFKQSFSINMAASLAPYSYDKVASWKQNGSDCCSWDGVACSEVTGQVIDLNLRSSFLYGPINSSSSLFDLVHLQRLDLSGNDFMHSEIPSAIGCLLQLTSLNLTTSSFSGQIPKEIAQLTQLACLDLSRNVPLKLQSSLSFEHLAQSLRMLEELDLSWVNISSPVPHSLVNLTSLRFLAIRDCSLTGEFPSGIFNLPQLQFIRAGFNEKLTGYLPEFQTGGRLEHLRLAYTNFSGTIPDSIGNLKSLVTLILTRNSFWGSVPVSIGKLESLATLRLAQSSFSGSLPVSIGNLKSLQTLDLSESHLSGSLPVSIGNLKHLTWVDLHQSSFSGSLPASLGNLTELSYLKLSGNGFTGQISSLANLSKLTYLDLGDNEFKGQIPCLASMSELSVFEIGDNEFDGGILPNWFGKLTKLTSLGLSSSNISGGVPSFLSNLTQLTHLSLKSNPLHGPIPPSLMNLTQLVLLDLYNSSLQGPIPAFSKLENIIFLHLYKNNLSGIVEADVFLNLKQLTYLHLSDNYNITFRDSKNYTNATLAQFQVLGLAACNLNVFPSFLRSQNALQFLSLSKNNIPGQIPQWFLNCSKETLEMLILSNNLLTGFETHPHTLPWVGIHDLDLGQNMLQGSLLVPPPNTIWYSVQGNRLTGDIPPLICQVTSLHTLDFSHNNLTGIIPPCLGNNITSLSILMLKGNKFQGKIPNSFVKESKLELIDISENQLEGQLPRSLANCSMLQFVNFADNKVDDYFPFWLGVLSDLRILILRSNQFHGKIKSLLTIISNQFPKLHILDLSNNCFEGYLPQDYMIQSWPSMKNSEYSASYLEEFSDTLSHVGFSHLEYFDFSISITNRGVKREYVKVLNVFTVLDLSSNRLEGEISTAIGQLQGLQLLNLSNNHFTGSIPSSLANLTNLESLDLSRNKLSGKIPPQIAQLTYLAFLNVSQNSLVGPIPQGTQLSTFENTSYEGNLDLCGEPLSKKCGNPHELWINASRNEEDDESLFPTHALDWIIVSLGLTSGLIVGLIFGNYLTDRHRHWFVRKFGHIRILK